MAAASDSEKAEFSAKVDRKLYDRFRELFPGYGATTYFINTSLEKFLAQCENDPVFIVRVQMAIDNMVETNRQASQNTPAANGCGYCSWSKDGETFLINKNCPTHGATDA